MQPRGSLSCRHGGAPALHAALWLLSFALAHAHGGGGDARLNAVIIEVRRPLSAGVRNNRHHISLDELVALDEENRRIPLRFVDASVQVRQGRQGRAPANAIDGDLRTRTHNNFGPGVRYGVEDHWMQFAFDAQFGSHLRKVRVHATHHAAKQRMKGVKLSLLLPTKGNALIAQKAIEFWGGDTFEWDLPLEVQKQLSSLPLDEVVDSLQAKVEELQKWNSNLEQQVTELQAQLAAPMASHHSLFDTVLGAAERAERAVPLVSPLYVLVVGGAALLMAQTLKQQQAHIKGGCAGAGGDLELCDVAQAWRSAGKDCNQRKDLPAPPKHGAARHVIRIEVSGQKKLQDLANRVLLRLPSPLPPSAASGKGEEPAGPGTSDLEANAEGQCRPDDEVYELVDARALADGACTLELQRKPARSPSGRAAAPAAAAGRGGGSAAAASGAGSTLGLEEEEEEEPREAEKQREGPQEAEQEVGQQVAALERKQEAATAEEEGGEEAEEEGEQHEAEEEGGEEDEEEEQEQEQEQRQGGGRGADDEGSESDSCSDASSIVLVESTGTVGFD